MPKPIFPTRGQKSPNFWDDDLKAYIDHGTSLEIVNGGTVALDDTLPEGATLGYSVKANTTFSGDGAETTLTPGVYSVVRTETGWQVYEAPAGLELGTEPDSTAPTGLAGFTATGGEGSATLGWTPATDSESDVVHYYRVYLTSGGPSGDWIEDDGSAGAVVTGLTAGTYSAQVYASSAGGSSTVITSSSFAVTAPLTTYLMDTFNRADGAMIPDRATPDTGTAWTADSALSSVQISGNKVTTGDVVVYSPTTLTTREITASILFPSGTGYVTVGGYSADYIKATVKANGQVEFSGATGNAIYNASGGTNHYTPTGYITGLTTGTHTMRVTYDEGIAILYVDDVKILEVSYPNPPAAKQAFIRAGTSGYIDTIEFKS